MNWTTILTSAVVGALVAALIQLVGQWAERRARRRELIFKFAVEAARVNNELTFHMARETKNTAYLKDHVVMAANYYPLVSHIFDKGKLPPNAAPAPGDEPAEGFSGLR
jgi:hypothetical protein